MKKRYIIFSLILNMALVGCGPSLAPLSMPSQTSFMLNALPSTPQRICHHSQTLLVTMPDSNALYDTTQMVYSVSPLTMNYYAKHRWAETPARMLQIVMVQAFQKYQVFSAVSASPSLGQYDFVLDTELVALKQKFEGASSHVVLILNAALVRTLDNKIIASQSFSVTEPAPQNTPYGGAVAANRATAKLLTQLMKMVDSSIHAQ